MHGVHIYMYISQMHFENQGRTNVVCNYTHTYMYIPLLVCKSFVVIML